MRQRFDYYLLEIGQAAGYLVCIAFVGRRAYKWVVKTGWRRDTNGKRYFALNCEVVLSAWEAGLFSPEPSRNLPAT